MVKSAQHESCFTLMPRLFAQKKPLLPKGRFLNYEETMWCLKSKIMSYFPKPFLPSSTFFFLAV